MPLMRQGEILQSPLKLGAIWRHSGKVENGMNTWEKS